MRQRACRAVVLTTVMRVALRHASAVGQRLGSAKGVGEGVAITAREAVAVCCGGGEAVGSVLLLPLEAMGAVAARAMAGGSPHSRF